ncbi:MFS transporter [Actinomadura rupiterrae]|uniref:MFS transporter n=1 Tax=Actinomadura rupiterrae TaxID=559627 RepID=UPI0020A27F25|nr:MFS transporter [Actinomadura rupiterrae]MCP2336842.1 DHA2 family multidrug resistance protein-like MFS transporter [Actinomadura rupiterrae]
MTTAEPVETGARVPQGGRAAAPDPRRWAGLAVLSASLLLVVMDMTVLNVALPGIAADLRPSSISLLWMVDVYSLVVSGLLVTWAAVGDRWGRKRMLLTGFALFGLASLAVLWADSPGAVIAVRAVLGVGGAMIMPSTLSMIRNLFPDPRERATALGVWATTAALGGALGPILGGALLEAFSWHSAFLVNVPVMAVAVVAAWFLLPESRNPHPGPWDAVGAVLSIIGMVALVYAIKHIGKDGLTGGALAATAVAVAALGWFVRRCLNREHPLLDVRLLRGRAFSAGIVTALTVSTAAAATMLLLAQWMQVVQGYSPLESGVRLLPEAVGAAVFSPLAPAIAHRIGARAVLSGGLLLIGAGFVTLFLGPRPLGYPTVAVALLVVGIGLGALAVASAVIMAGAPPARSGSAAAFEETSYELGGALGVAVLGSLAAAVFRHGLPASDLAAAGITGPAAGQARESIAGAVEVARPVGAHLVAEAEHAFTTSLEWTGLAGGALMLAAAVAVWLLTPRDLDLADSEH